MIQRKIKCATKVNSDLVVLTNHKYQNSFFQIEHTKRNLGAPGSLVFTCSNMSSTLFTEGDRLIEGFSSNTSKGASTICNTKQVNKNMWKCNTKHVN
jgi:hypothetical protein